MGGVEAASFLRASYPNLLLVASSGYAQNPALLNFRDYGFDQVLVKPYRIQDIAQLSNDQKRQYQTTRSARPKNLSEPRLSRRRKMLKNYPTLAHLTVGCALLGGLVALIRHKARPTLESLVGCLLAASSIPSGLFLLVCAFDSSLIRHLPDLGIYLAAAGIALLYVSIKQLAARD